jgi:hypothetical protein
MPKTNRQERFLPLGALALGILILGVMPLGCTREAPAPPDEGTQVSQNQQPADAAPAPQAAPAAPTQVQQQAPPVAPPAPVPAPRRNPAPPRAAAPATAAAPAAPKPPETIALTVPQSTTLKVKMEDALDSGTSQPGDHFMATLQEPVVLGDRVVLPAGSSVEGTVTEVIPAKKGMKESGGALTLSFDKVTTPSGDSAAMSASLSEVAKSTKKKAGTIGGAAAGGALLGKIFGGSTKDAAVGAVVGGAIGTGVAAGTKGTEMKIAAGTPLTITLQQPLTMHLKR